MKWKKSKKTRTDSPVVEFWERGSGTILAYFAMMWLIALAAILFIEYYHAFSNAGRNQIYADIIADGSAYIGNNGWGLNEKEAGKAIDALKEYNENALENTTIRTKYSYTDGNGNISNVKINGSNKTNTVTASTKTKTTMVTKPSQKLKFENTATTRITYSGGMKIVYEAWTHSYDYVYAKGYGGRQTQYVWGGGHGDGTGWETYADCSGFVSGVFRKCGYNVPSYSYTGTLESTGVTVARNYQELYQNARPGDIILYWRNGENGNMQSQHVTIYAGCYNGTHYQIHSRGGTANTIYNPGGGASGGVQLTPIEQGASRVQVQRIVDSDGVAEHVPEAKIGALTNNESTIYLIMKEYGLTNIAIAGIMGNWRIESGCNPIMRQNHSGDLAGCQSYASSIKNGRISKQVFAYENGSEGYGLAQWTTTSPVWQADRKAQLWDYAGQMGSNVTDLFVQVSFAMKEMQDRGLIAQLNSCQDPAAAANIVLAKFEGIPGHFSAPLRMQAANQYYNSFH